MLYIYRWIKGYLKVIFYGNFYEKIMNITSKNGIILWNTKLIKNGIESNIYINDFKKLRNLIRGKEIKVKIVKKHGLPYKIEKNKKRTGFLLGLIAFMTIIQMMSGYIWIIDIKGNNKVSSKEIMSACDELGIRLGVKSNRINSKTDSQRLLLKTNELSWASMNIEGSRLTVNVSEVKVSKDEDYPSNLKAGFDGIIKKIDVKSGNCLVKVGDAVKKGDVLVSGIIENINSTQFVKSQGVITAIATQNLSVLEEFKQTYTEATGKEKTKYLLEIFSFKIPLYLGTEKGNFETNFHVNKTVLFGTRLPISLYEKKFIFLNEKNKTLNNYELQKLLKIKMEKLIKEKNIKNYTIKREEFVPTTHGLMYNILISFEENIAVREKIIISNK